MRLNSRKPASKIASRPSATRPRSVAPRIQLRQFGAGPEALLEVARLRVSARSSTRFLRKMITHEAIDANSSSSITSCTGQAGVQHQLQQVEVGRRRGRGVGGLPRVRRCAARLPAGPRRWRRPAAAAIGSHAGVSTMRVSVRRTTVAGWHAGLKLAADNAATRTCASSRQLAVAADCLREHQARAAAFAQRDATPAAHRPGAPAGGSRSASPAPRTPGRVRRAGRSWPMPRARSHSVRARSRNARYCAW